MSNKVYSRNEEDWYDLSETMASLEEDYKKGDVVEIQQGESVQFQHDDFIHPAHIAEYIQNTAYDEIGEWQQDYLEDLVADADKLQELKKVLVHFITNNTKPPACFKVVNVKNITVTVGE
jgi:hypothetical protein